MDYVSIFEFFSYLKTSTQRLTNFFLIHLAIDLLNIRKIENSNQNPSLYWVEISSFLE